MDAVWQSIAQSGIAVLILALVSHQLWKRYQKALDAQALELEALKQSVAVMQKEKDEMHREFIATMKQSQEKYERLSTQQRQAMEHNTEVLQGLQDLLKNIKQ